MGQSPRRPAAARKVFSGGFLAVFVLLLLPDANAQALRPEQTLFIQPRVGFSWYLGDTEMSPFNFNMDNWKVDGNIPYAAGLELGYQFNQTTSLSFGWQITNNPAIFHYGDPTDAELTRLGDDETIFNGVHALLRFARPTRVAPFFALGGHVTFGQDDRTSTAFGPTIGLGLDIVLSNRVSLVIQNLTSLSFPDDAIDGASSTHDAIPAEARPLVEDKSFLPFDLLSSATAGLKINFRSAFVPVMIVSSDCPSELQLGQAGTFTAASNPDATQPVTYSWNFGDGTTASGGTVSHAYTSGGTYTATVTASNQRSSDSATCTVSVAGAPAEIVSINASQTRFDVCEPTTVQFDANVQGDAPISYEWDFGDGTTGTGAQASHTYSAAGTYTVRLTATNEFGTDTRTLTITAEPCIAGICFEIAEMNSVFFDRNSSTLTAEGRAALQENLEIFRQCPNLGGRIEGYAAPGERNPQELSTDRARAVEQFYVEGGIPATRFQTQGRGVLPGVTKKDDALARRVDTIPVQLEEL